MGELRHVDFGRNHDHDEHEHCDHSHEKISGKELANYINFVAQQLNEYNHKVAKITHQEHLLRQ